MVHTSLQKSDTQQRQQCLIHQLYAPRFYCILESVTVLANWCSDNLQSIDLYKPKRRLRFVENSGANHHRLRNWLIKGLFTTHQKGIVIYVFIVESNCFVVRIVMMQQMLMNTTPHFGNLLDFYIGNERTRKGV